MNFNAPAKPFEKGNSGGPGRPALPKELKEIKNATKEKLYNCFFKYQTLTDNEVLEIKASGNLTLLEQGILKSLEEFKKSGDYLIIKYPLDQIIGRARESLDLNTGGNVQLVISQSFVPDLDNTNTTNADKSK